MAGNIVVRFTGDASGLAAFYSNIGTQTDAFLQRMQKSYSGQFSKLLGLNTQKLGLTDARGKPVTDIFGKQQFRRVGTDVGNLKVQLDGLNDVLRVTATTGFKLKDGSFFPIGTTEVIRGSVTELNKANQALGELLVKRDALQSRYGGYTGQLTSERNSALQAADPFKAARNNASTTLAALRAQRDALTLQLSNRRKGVAEDGTIIDLSKLRGASRTSFDTRTNQILAERNTIQKLVEKSARALASAQAAYDKALDNPAITNYDERLSKLRSRQAQILNGLRSDINKARGNIAGVLSNENVAPPVGYSNLPSALKKQLGGAGLGAGQGTSLGQILASQNASFGAPVRDLERGITEFSGTFERLMNIEGRMVPVQQRWSASVDDSGKVVTSFGRNLRGLSRIADQISRDFQKVIEWTVATTLVFGSLQAAGQGLQVIKEIDADLTRFAVTANLSATQAQVFYGSLVQIADVTATPLEEMVKAADDFALAVRKPGQTTEQLTTDIKTLAQAVGIYTNLTGQDTVTATDELVAVMKQFGVSAAGVYTILNKVTAAAGGQSGAIADITRGLAVMAEAGKQANLTVDQQIGVIKTLSQVTSKSPAEVATAFKNLVGALSNPAAIKALTKYNIGLISQGNDIISIYEQIAQKIRTGKIAAGDVSGLLRSISGGPRRSPDAAALLGNINQVVRETTVSENATNEAFLANAQIVDTLQAKFVRFENILKDKTFQQFGKVFKDAATVGLSFATKFLDAFGVIPPQLISGVAALGALAVAFKFLQKALSSISFSFLAAKESEDVFLSGFPLAILGEKETAAAIEQTNISLRERIALSVQSARSGLNGLKGGLGGIGLGTAIGAGAAALTGGGPAQIVGGGLQGLGLGLLTVPEPTGYTKLAGGIALVAGTLLTFVQSSDAATEAASKNSQAILNAYDSAQQAAGSLNAIIKDQNNIEGAITQQENLSVKQRDINYQSDLNDLYKQYADNLIAASAAQDQLNQATKDFQDLQSQIPGAETLDSRLRGLVLGNNQDPQIQKIIRESQVQLLKQTFPEIQGTADQVKLFQITQAGNSLPENGSPTVSYNAYNQTVGKYGGLTQIKTADINNLTPNVVKNFFKVGTDGSEQFNASLDLSRTAIDKINTELNKLPNGDEYKKAFDAFLSGKDSINDATQALEYYKKGAKGIGVLYADVGDQLDKVLAGAGKILSTGTANVSSKEYTATLNDFFAATRQSENTGQLIPNDKLHQFGEETARALGLTKGLSEGTQQYKAVVDEVSAAFYGWVPPLDAANKAIAEMSDSSKAVFSGVQDAVNSVLSDIATQSSNAFAGLLNGSLSPAQYSKVAARLNDVAKSIKEVRKSFSDAQPNGDNFVNVFNAFKGSLKGIPGLQDAASLSAGDLIKRVYDLANAYGVGAKGIDKIGQKISDLNKALIILSNSPYKIYIGADISGLKKALIAMRNALAHISPNYTGGPTGLSIAAGQANDLQAAIDAIGTVTSFKGDIQSIYNSGNGQTNGSSGGKSGGGGGKSGPNVSTLDLPDEIANAENRSSLINEAIKRAKALQSKIPGATKDAKNDIVELLKGTQRILEVRGVKDDYLRKALEELAAIEKKRLDFETKADTIRRIRVGQGDFSAIANVPVNSATGVSVGGPNGPINITFNLNGTVLTPAEASKLANQIAAAIKRQLANG